MYVWSSSFFKSIFKHKRRVKFIIRILFTVYVLVAVAYFASLSLSFSMIDLSVLIVVIILFDNLSIFSIYCCHCFWFISFCYFGSIWSVFCLFITFFCYMSSSIVCIELSVILVICILIVQHVFIKFLIKEYLLLLYWTSIYKFTLNL